MIVSAGVAVGGIYTTIEENQHVDEPPANINTAIITYDSQYDEIGTKRYLVMKNRPFHLPHLKNNDPSREFYGWCQDKDGTGIIIPPGTEIRVGTDRETMYGIWGKTASETTPGITVASVSTSEIPGSA